MLCLKNTVLECKHTPAKTGAIQFYDTQFFEFLSIDFHDSMHFVPPQYQELIIIIRQICNRLLYVTCRAGRDQINCKTKFGKRTTFHHKVKESEQVKNVFAFTGDICLV